MYAVVRLILAIIAIFLLPCCGSHTKKNKKAAFKRAAFSMPKIQTNIDVEQVEAALEAKLTDIPTTIGSRIVSIVQISEQPYQLRVSFECTQNLSELNAFYSEQMIYNGWQTVATIAGDELMHIYKKPNKICVIILKQKNSKCVQIALAISEVSKDL
jgi:hypothetical protein